MKYNTNLYGTRLYNGGESITEAYSGDVLVFDGFSLSDNESMILTDLRLSGPSRDLIGGKVPRGHGMYLTDDQYGEYVIEAEGVAKKSTAAALDSFLDTIRKSLRRRERDLDYTQADGTVKRFVATVTNFDEMFADRRHSDVTKCPWRARFVCKTPFARSRGYTSVSEAITTSPTSLSVYHAGTAPARPVVTLVFDAASSVTAVSVKNTATGEEIAYSGSVAANDALVFDCEDKRVRKNGVEADFQGAFLTLEPGSQLIQFTVTGTSFNAYCTVSHRAAYL